METRGRIAAAAGQQCEMPGFGIDMAKTWEPYDVLWWAFNVWLVRACPRRPDDVVQRVQGGWWQWHPSKGFLAQDILPCPIGRAGNSKGRAKQSKPGQGERETRNRDNKACQSIRVCGAKGEAWMG